MNSSITRSDIQQQIANMDIDGDGNIGEKEIEEFAKKFIREKKDGQEVRNYLFIALAVIILLAVSNIGTGYLAATLAKEFTVVGDDITTNDGAKKLIQVKNVDDSASGNGSGGEENTSQSRSLIQFKENDKFCNRGIFEIKRKSGGREDTKERRRHLTMSGLDKHNVRLVGPEIDGKVWEKYIKNIDENSPTKVCINVKCDSQGNRKKRLKENIQNYRNNYKGSNDDEEWYYYGAGAHDRYDDDNDDKDADDYEYDDSDDADDTVGDDFTRNGGNRNTIHSCLKYSVFRQKSYRGNDGDMWESHMFYESHKSNGLTTDVPSVLQVLCRRNKSGKSYCKSNKYMQEYDNIQHFKTDYKKVIDWSDAKQFCMEKGLKLLREEDICPRGKAKEGYSTLMGRKYRNQSNWVAIRGLGSNRSNTWVDITPDNGSYKCVLKEKPESNNFSEAWDKKNNIVFCLGV